MIPDVLILIAVFILSLALTWIIRRYAQQRLLDIPNERSSHTVPTPRGGGLAIVISFSLALIYFAATGRIPSNVLIALLGGGGLVAFIGWMDDQRPVSWQVRALVHVGAAIFGLVALGGMPPLDLGIVVIEWGVIGHIIGVIGIVWLINLYNFMDGIDGLAAGEAVTVALAAGWIVGIGVGVDLTSRLPIFALAFAAFGFLIFNWQPAKIFMGDVGSGFLGYTFAILAIWTVSTAVTRHAQSIGEQGLSLWVWIILLGYFLIDASLTLLRRVLRGDKWYSAHRTHAYQKWVISGASHRRVTLTILAINLFWLTPLAVAAVLFKSVALVIASIALAPLVVMVAHFRAGTPNE